VVEGLHSPFPRRFATRTQLNLRSIGKRLHSKVREHLVGNPQLIASVNPSTLPPQPLAVEQVGSGMVDRDARSCEPFDGFGIEVIGAEVIRK
jgi:hypothetical protein